MLQEGKERRDGGDEVAEGRQRQRGRSSLQGEVCEMKLKDNKRIKHMWSWSRQREPQLWVQQPVLPETHRAAVMSAQAAKPAGPPAVTAHTGLVVISTARFYSHIHSLSLTHTHMQSNKQGQTGKGVSHKGT